MASLTLKNVPDELLQSLRETARAERRSVNQQALQLLSEVLRERRHAKPSSPNRSRSHLAAWRAIAGTWRSEEDAETEIKRIYKRRTRGRKTDL